MGLVFRVVFQNLPVAGGSLVITLQFQLQSAHGGIQVLRRLTIPQSDLDFLNGFLNPALQMQNDRPHYARRDLPIRIGL